jgi:hypothetical protein
LLGGFASDFKKTEEKVKEMRVNGDTAEGNLRELQNEKATVASRLVWA